MPSTSPAEAKLMAIAAHTPGGYGGVPQSVGKDFHAADKKQGKYKYGGGKTPGKTSGKTSSSGKHDPRKIGNILMHRAGRD